MQNEKLHFLPRVILVNGQVACLKMITKKTAALGGWRYDFSLINNTSRSLKIARVPLFEIVFNTEKIEVFRQGFYMPGDPADFVVLKRGALVPPNSYWKPVWHDKYEFVSHTLVMVKKPAWPQLLTMGFVSFQRFQGVFACCTKGKAIRVVAWCYLENLCLSSLEVLPLESVLVFVDSDFNSALAKYSEYTGRSCHARVPRQTVIGWVDWQYYREEKNEHEIMKSVRVLQSLRKRGYPFRYVIIDGGWCSYASEWLEPCPKFPNIKRLCHNIRRAGLIPGLWFAPYITNVKTKIAQRHKDWLVRDAKTGLPLFRPRSNVGPCYVLDFTVPAALAWLRKIVRVMVRDWRVGYIKLDGPCLTHYEGGVFHAANVTAIEQIRHSLSVIREECGDEVLVEGEGVYGPSIGFVDIQRVQQDTNTAWYRLEDGLPLLKANLKNDLLSAFLHRRWWHNHRENVVLRDFPSPFHAHTTVARTPQLKDYILTENQVLSQISATALAGGAMLLSDPMEELVKSQHRFDLVRRFLPHFEKQQPAQPYDVFQNGEWPSIYYLPVMREFEEWYVLGCFNWSDVYSNFIVPLHKIIGDGSWHVFDFWNEEYLSKFLRSKSQPLNGRRLATRGALLVENVPPHGCRVLALRRKLNRPQLVGTNIHILQGAVELTGLEYDDRKKKLCIVVNHFDLRERRLFIWHPRRWREVCVATNAQNYLLDNRRPNLLVVQFNGHRAKGFFRKTEFELQF